MNKIIKSVKKVIQKSTAPKMWPATIVTSGSRTGYTKVKFSNGFEMDVLNYRIASIPDMKISVGYDPMMPGALQVLGIREDLRYLGDSSAYTFFIVDHHKNHEYPNHDVVWVQGAQIIPNNVLPKGDNLEVQVYGSIMRTAGDWVAMRSTTMDLTSHVPATGSRYVLIEMDTDGTAIATDGVTKSFPLLTIGDIPEPTSGRMPIAAVLLRAGQTVIKRDVRSGHRNDIHDLRWSGWSRGGRADDFDMAGAIHAATASAITDDDEMGFWESVADGLRKITWANVKATLKTYFDTLYLSAVVALSDLSDVSIVAPADGEILVYDDYTGTWVNTPPGAGSGDVVGPAGATDNAIARYHAATGKLIQDSLATVDDAGSVNIPTGETYKINGSPHTHADVGITWNEVTGTSETMAVSNGYIANNAGLVTLTLPDTAPVGSVVRVTGKGTGGWKIAQNASEIIHFGNVDTTTGAGGSLASVEDRDSVELVCVVADTEWNVISSIGNITVI